jgi:hypothetical protein
MIWRIVTECPESNMNFSVAFEDVAVKLHCHHRLSADMDRSHVGLIGVHLVIAHHLVDWADLSFM